jgi:HPt (histidine-containing phosphotransfer) domain-containing protein
MTAIEGLDYDTALSHCAGDEAFLEEIVHDVVSECDKRVEKMRKSLATGEIEAYEIEAHTIKSTMATIGMNCLSERARKHEYAAKSMETEFIFEDAEDFIHAYIAVCKQLEGCETDPQI